MSSSSSSTKHWIYDVFLSFRGSDTRNGFTSHLYAALSNNNILTFMDDEGLSSTMEIKPELVRAIEGSRMSIVVFSENYTGSKWCLDELVKIMECCRNYGQQVLPIFYKVDPSTVRKQQGAFGEHLEAFQMTKGPDILRSWRHALTDAANLAGFHHTENKMEGQLIDDIIETVLTRLDKDSLSIPEFLVGLELGMQQVIEFIETHEGRGCVVGIGGMGGLGKTTMAKVIYRQIRRRFMRRCFIENIRQVDVNNGKDCIDFQERLLSGLQIDTREKIQNTAMGTALIEKSLVGKRALILLDDVTDFEQLKTLCGNIESILQDSVLIITTRDARLFNVLQANHHMVHIVRIRELNQNESLKLFRWHAFREENTAEDLIKLSWDVVDYCGGLPLALELLGSYLFERRKEEWEDVLSKLKKIPNDKVLEKLRISYDGLDSDQKKIFLDVCFFFIGKDRADVTEILKGCDLHPEIGITTLVERNLIQLQQNNKLNMHDLIRDMGREIVRQSSEEEPEKRSRLWAHQEVLDVLSDQTGTEAIHGLTLKLQRNSGLRFSTKAFEKMKKLRLMKLDHVELVGDYDYLNKNLRWVCWQGFPLKHIPDNLYQGNLVSIELKYSEIRQVWMEPQFMERLKILNLSHSKNLICTPDFSRLPNLAKLILKDCPRLAEVHQSIGDLTNLLMINLKDCTSLSNLPRAIYQLKSLQTLNISGCSKIDKMEEDMVQMVSLTALIAKDTALKELPRSTVRLKSIGYISLCGHEGLAREIFPSLIWSWMSPTANLGSSTTQPFGSMSNSLISLDIRHKSCVDLSPMLHGVSKLGCILVECDSEFQLTQELRIIMDAICDVKFTEMERTSCPLQVSENAMKSFLIGMGSCDQLVNMLSKSIAEGMATNEACDAFLPGDNYPYWLAHTGEGPSVRFSVPEDCCMKGMAFCVFYLSTPENTAIECLTSVLIVNHTKCTIQIYKKDTVISSNDEDWQSIISHLGSGDKVEIFVTFDSGFVVKKTAVYLIYGEPIDVNMEPSPEVMKKIEMDPLAHKTFQDLPIVEVSSSRLLDLARVDMEITETNIFPEVSSTLEKINQAVPGIGAPNHPTTQNVDNLWEDESNYEILEEWVRSDSELVHKTRTGENQPIPNVEYLQSWNDFKSFAFDDDLITNLFKVNFEVNALEKIDKLVEQFGDLIMPENDRKVIDNFTAILKAANSLEKMTKQINEDLKNLEVETQDDRSKLESERVKTRKMKSSYVKFQTRVTQFEQEEANIEDQIKSLQCQLQSIKDQKKKAIEERDALIHQRKESMSIENSLSSSLRTQLQKKVDLERRKAITKAELEALAKKHSILRFTL